MLIGLSVLSGPNVFAQAPVVRAIVDLLQVSRLPSTCFGSAYSDSLHKLLGSETEIPQIRMAATGEPEAFARGLMGFARTLQRSCGGVVEFGEVRLDGTSTRAEVIVGYDDKDVGLEAVKLACQVMGSLATGDPRSQGQADLLARLARKLARYREFASSRAANHYARFLCQEADRRDIPWRRFGAGALTLGQGRYQRRTSDSFTEHTSFIAVQISSDKALTNGILDGLGLPVARQITVQSAAAAVAAAGKIGYPVVVKPVNTDYGLGIAVHLTDPAQVRVAFDRARAHAPAVIVEAFVAGDDHRLLVVDGRLVAASKRVPGCVIGDGQRSVADLVAALNRDPRRGRGEERLLTRLELNKEAQTVLSERGYSPRTVPGDGEIVYLRRTANLSTGGTAIDVTESIHEDNAAMAVAAAEAIGLDVAGIDFLTTDITRSYRQIGGAICEANCTPGLRMHHAPSEGMPRNVAGAILDHLFPPGAPSRIPIAALLGANKFGHVGPVLAHILKFAGRRVGLAGRDGLFLDGTQAQQGDMSGSHGSQALLGDRRVETMVLDLSLGKLVTQGLGFDRCSVVALLAAEGDHDEVDESQAALARSLLVGCARETVVLNADDPLCHALADDLPSNHMVLVSSSSDSPPVSTHVEAGGAAVVPGSNGGEVLLRGGREAEVVKATQVQNLHGRNVQTTLLTTAIAWAMGLSAETIGEALASYPPEVDRAGG